MLQLKELLMVFIGNLVVWNKSWAYNVSYVYILKIVIRIEMKSTFLWTLWYTKNRKQKISQIKIDVNQFSIEIPVNRIFSIEIVQHWILLKGKYYWSLVNWKVQNLQYLKL